MVRGVSCWLCGIGLVIAGLCFSVGLAQNVDEGSAVKLQEVANGSVDWPLVIEAPSEPVPFYLWPW